MSLGCRCSQFRRPKLYISFHKYLVTLANSNAEKLGLFTNYYSVKNRCTAQHGLLWVSYDSEK